MGILPLPPSVRPSAHPSRYLLLNHWTKSNRIRCGCCSRHIFWPRPLGPWEGAKRSNIIKYQYISITNSISKLFKPNFVCLLINERYKVYYMGFSFGRPGHAWGWNLGVPCGGGGGGIGCHFFLRNSTRVGM